MSEVAHRERVDAGWRSRVPWYQASYNYAANLLHLALDAEIDAGARDRDETIMLLRTTVTLPVSRVAPEQEIDEEADAAQSLEMSVLVAREREGVTILRPVAVMGLLRLMRIAFHQALTAAFVAGAKEEATSLLRTTLSTIRFGRPTNIWRWWGVLPSGDEGRVLRRFLEEEVEPKAAVSLAGALVEGDREYSFDEVEAPSRSELEWRLRNRESVSPAELMAYAASVVEKLERSARAVVGLGRRRSNDPAAEHYNFACFYSRVAARTPSAAVRAQALDKSVAELESFFANEPRRHYRLELARWARNDPSLAEVRSAARTQRRFEQIIQRNLPATSPRVEEEDAGKPAATAAT